ncbi:DUF1403 family protein [Aquamicrobium segne]|uniref:DUF1403 family protein n=1 Tax=Aquamicrobium segne TaxID=469547 RepID=A0ABW0H3U9_9HYPH
MVLIHKTLPRRTGKAAPGSEGAEAKPLPVVAHRLRQILRDDKNLAGQTSADLALTAGAALAGLEFLVRRHEAGAKAGFGVWRQRLALSAAARTVRAGGRSEDEAALRDAVLLTRAGDDPGPAGQIAHNWQRLVTRPVKTLLTREHLALLVKGFGYAARESRALDELADELALLVQSPGLAQSLSGAVIACERHGLGQAVGALAADLVLARRLGWDHVVPLLGVQGLARRRMASMARMDGQPAPASQEDQDLKDLLVRLARAALHAHDLAVTLELRAQKLLLAAPKLRARAALQIVEHLLNEDGLIATRSVQMNGISERGLRRLFDRLVELGVVRELTGRPTFRIYGL